MKTKIETYGIDVPLQTQQEYDDMKRALETVNALLSSKDDDHE